MLDLVDGHDWWNGPAPHHTLGRKLASRVRRTCSTPDHTIRRRTGLGGSLIMQEMSRGGDLQIRATLLMMMRLPQTRRNQRRGKKDSPKAESELE